MRVEERRYERPMQRYERWPARVQMKPDIGLRVAVEAKALAAAVRLPSWRAYGIHTPAEQPYLSQAV